MRSDSLNNDSSQEDDTCFKSVPQNLLRYLDKYIKVSSISGNTVIEGVCYSVDPVTESPVLMSVEDNQFVVKLIPGHLVGIIEFVSNKKMESEIRQHMLMRSETITSNPKSLKTRRSTLLIWLQRNRIPVEEEGDEIVLGNVLRILPPYTVDSVLTSKETVLKKVIDIMESIPL